jgi:hypothetical protein
VSLSSRTATPAPRRSFRARACIVFDGTGAAALHAALAPGTHVGARRQALVRVRRQRGLLGTVGVGDGARTRPIRST